MIHKGYYISIYLSSNSDGKSDEHYDKKIDLHIHSHPK